MKIRLGLLVSALVLVNVSKAQPVLRIESHSHQFAYTSSELRSRNDVSTVTINNNRAYPHLTLSYTAIKLCDLLKNASVRKNDMVEFIAADQFSVLVPARAVMHCSNNSAIGYLAIEPTKKWPIIKNKTGTTAGPFDVIWVHPEKSYISDEYWAWSVVKIKVQQHLDPAIYISPPKASAEVRQGYDVYIAHCAGCHSLNHQGKGVIGPDLNVPLNATEIYYPDAKLKQFIRDPQSIRNIKNDRMSGSGEKFLSEKDLNDLVLYLHYMRKHKKS